MSTIKFYDKKVFFLLIIFSLPNAAFNFLVLYIVNKIIKFNYENNYLFLYFGLIILSILFNALFQNISIKNTRNIICKKELLLIDKILNADVYKFENYKKEKIYGIIDDISSFSSYTYVLTTVVNSIITILLSLIYLSTISISIFLVIIFFILLLIFAYGRYTKSLKQSLHEVRDNKDIFNRIINDLILGFKEIVINSKLKKNIIKYSEINRDSNRKKEQNIDFKYANRSIISKYSLLLIIGILLIFFQYQGQSREDILSALFIVIFINTPINSLVANQRELHSFYMANKRIDTFFTEISNKIITKKDNEKNEKASFENELRIENLNFFYNNNNYRNFSLKKVDLKIDKGTILFITGGNGSGKSTFLKTLIGLYTPTFGKFYIDGKEITNQKQSYKELFSTVFTDNHLFSENYKEIDFHKCSTYKQLVKKLKINNVIENYEQYPFKNSFSKGQEKRLLLILAILENKPILILDEWTAEQDPEFREFFYVDLLPYLKSIGKTVIAVTHDDRYFGYAEKIVKFENGELIQKTYE